MRSALRIAAAGLLALPAVATAQTSAGNHCHVRVVPLQGQYAGECSGGIANGRGRSQGTDRYEGGWKDGLPHGDGVYSFADGRRFEGRFEAGKVNGPARHVYANGDVLEGEFRADQLHGPGRLVRRSGEVIAVQMQDGALVPLAVAATAPPPPAAAPAPPPAVPAEAAAVAVCEGRLRLQAQALQRTGPGQLQLTLSVQNLANADLRLDGRNHGHLAQTYLVDDEGLMWRSIAPRRGDGTGFDERVFQPGQPTRVLMNFGLATGGHAARRFNASAAVTMRPAQAGGPPGLAGTCRFELRGLGLTTGP